MGQALLCTQCGTYQQDNDIDYYLFLMKSIQSSQYISTQDRKEVFENLKTKNMYVNSTLNKGVLSGKKFGFYQGQINLNKFAHGQGRLVFINQNQYRGNFTNGKFQGQGKLIDHKNNIQFNGHWEDGEPIYGDLKRQNTNIKLSNIKIEEGGRVNAKLNIDNSIDYEGDLSQKVFDKKTFLVFQGEGRMKFPDGSQYAGKWFDSKMQGYGTYTWKNGNKYEGFYKNGLRNGQGKMFWKDQNEVFDGFWVNGHPSPISKITPERENLGQSRDDNSNEDQ